MAAPQIPDNEPFSQTCARSLTLIAEQLRLLGGRMLQEVRQLNSRDRTFLTVLGLLALVLLLVPVLFTIIGVVVVAGAVLSMSKSKDPAQADGSSDTSTTQQCGTEDSSGFEGDQSPPPPRTP